jgi:hypothetical protein
MRYRCASRLLALAVSATAFAWNIGYGQSAAGEEVFASPETLVRGLYAAVTFGPGSTPDWDHVRSFFIPEAVFGVRKTRTSMEVLNVDAFVDWFISDIKKFKMDELGFEETVQKLKLTEYGNIAQCFVVYRARLKTPADSPGQLGLDSFSLMKKDGRWWIVSVANDIISPQNPLPEELR